MCVRCQRRLECAELPSKDGISTQNRTSASSSFTGVVAEIKTISNTQINAKQGVEQNVDLYAKCIVHMEMLKMNKVAQYANAMKHQNQNADLCARLLAHMERLKIKMVVQHANATKHQNADLCARYFVNMEMLKINKVVQHANAKKRQKYQKHQNA